MRLSDEEPRRFGGSGYPFLHGPFSPARPPDISPSVRPIVDLSPCRSDDPIRRFERGERIERRGLTPIAPPDDDCLAEPVGTAPSALSSGASR